jgi:uncharacterized membrane protein required for colicin V production
MNTTDIALLILLFGFTWAGFWYGLIQTLGGIVGVIAGAVIAGRTYGTAAGWIASATNLALTQWVAFMVIFIVVNRLAAIAVGIIGKALNVVSIVPGVKSANRLGGALVGLVEGALVLGLIIAVAEHLNINATFVQLLDNSSIAKLLSAIGSSLMPLLPVALKCTQELLNI